VTTTLASVSRRMAAICSGSSSGLIGFTIPATAPPRIVTAVSVQLGSTKAMVSVSFTPSARNMLAAWVTRA
jgi:hypothetical protein